MSEVFTSYIVPATAIIGCFLGVFNTWRDISSKKIRVEVFPRLFAKPFGNSGDSLSIFSDLPSKFEGNPSYFGLHVINNSPRNVIITEVGFFQKKPIGWNTIVKPRLLTRDQPFPTKLEPGMSATFIEPINDFRPTSPIIFLFVRTACGRVFKSKSKETKILNRFFI